MTLKMQSIEEILLLNWRFNKGSPKFLPEAGKICWSKALPSHVDYSQDLLSIDPVTS